MVPAVPNRRSHPSAGRNGKVRQACDSADAGARPVVGDTGLMRVTGAHVLLTGATGDIGRRLAQHLAAAGADVTLVARRPEPLAELADEVGGRARPCDLTDRNQLRGLLPGVEREHRPV